MFTHRVLSKLYPPEDKSEEDQEGPGTSQQTSGLIQGKLCFYFIKYQYSIFVEVDLGSGTGYL